MKYEYQPSEREMELLAQLESTKYGKLNINSDKKSDTNFKKYPEDQQDYDARPPVPMSVRQSYRTTQIIIGVLIAVHSAMSVGMLLLIYYLIQSGQY